MLRRLRENKAQVSSGEYVVVIAVVLAVITVMAMYMRRGVQGRIHDARLNVIPMIRNRTAGSYSGNLYLEYEPYYTNASANTVKELITNDQLFSSWGYSSGIYRKDYDETSSTEAISDTAPPVDAN